MTGSLVPSRTLTLGLRENLPQFVLLVAVNALVGGMVGRNARSCRCWPSGSSGSSATPRC
jgi:hypothetical protein